METPTATDHSRNETGMAPEAQRVAIAEACGWTEIDRYIDQQRVSSGIWKGRNPKYPNGKIQDLSDYLNDLNAMHEAEKVLGMTDLTPRDKSVYGSNGSNYRKYLCAIAGNIGSIHATAAQRAEAFLRTLGLWKE